MHPDIVYDLYRQHLAEWARDAEVKRLLADTRPKRQRFRYILRAVHRLRRRRPPRTVAATARTCH
jgi:hypothetical protein